MAEQLPFAESEIRILSALLSARVKFIVVGLSAATLQGAPVVTQDVDLWFADLGDPKVSRALQSVGAAYVPPSPLNPPMLAGEGAELFDIVLRMDGLESFEREYRSCVDVSLGEHQLKVLPLERILASKVAANRQKDTLTIPVLRDAIRTTQIVARDDSPEGGKPEMRRSRKKHGG